MKPEIEWREYEGQWFFEGDGLRVGFIVLHEGYPYSTTLFDTFLCPYGATKNMPNKVFKTLEEAKSWIEEQCAPWLSARNLTHTPPGYVLVPEEPTEAMMVAALNELAPLGSLVDWKETFDRDYPVHKDVTDVYKAMIGARHKE